MSQLIHLTPFILLLSSGVATVAAGPVEAARGVVGRLLPQHADQFVLEQIASEGDRDVFEIESIDGKVVVRGNTGVAIASGVNWYLKYDCNCHVSFNGDQLALPERLPAVKGKIRQTSLFQYRYMFNFLCFQLHAGLLGLGSVGADDRLDGPAWGEHAAFGDRAGGRLVQGLSPVGADR